MARVSAPPLGIVLVVGVLTLVLLVLVPTIRGGQRRSAALLAKQILAADIGAAWAHVARTQAWPATREQLVDEDRRGLAPSLRQALAREGELSEWRFSLQAGQAAITATGEGQVGVDSVLPPYPGFSHTIQAIERDGRCAFHQPR